MPAPPEAGRGAPLAEPPRPEPLGAEPGALAPGMEVPGIHALCADAPDAAVPGADGPGALGAVPGTAGVVVAEAASEPGWPVVGPADAPEAGGAAFGRCAPETVSYR